MNTKKCAVKLFDTTLRDGSQAEGISLSVDDKVKIAHALDRLGIHYIEGGWPGSNPKDELFFKEARKMRFNHSRIVAFGSTRRKDTPAHRDANLLSILKVKAPVACIFGKSWDFQVVHALRTSLGENLKMISDSVRFLKSKGLEVVYDAEHFFDGFKTEPDYALATLRAAWEAGADNLSLCDTNGGSIPTQVSEIVSRVGRTFPLARLGIHAHNDSDCAVANSVAAVQHGCVLVQGTVNGYGERCGNANLISITANLQLKLGIPVITDQQMQSLTEISRYISEVVNLVPNDHQPYVGISAFAHKAGVHVAAMARHSKTYEHIAPAVVGNQRRILISELSGLASIQLKAQELKLDFSKESGVGRQVIDTVKKMEHQGFQFEGAEGSFALLVQKALGKV